MHPYILTQYCVAIYRRDNVYLEHSVQKNSIINTELNDWRLMTCLRKFEDTVERISVCNVIEKLMELGIAPIQMTP